jgi:hypothetical protein
MLTFELHSGWELDPSKPKLNGTPWERGGVVLKRFEDVVAAGEERTKKQSVVSLNSVSFGIKNQYTLAENVYFDDKFTDPQDSSSGFRFSQLDISMHVRRKTIHWLVAVIFPNALITASMLASYGLPHDDGSRLEVSVTVLLGLTTFKVFVAERLPEINYFTFMDGYILTAFLFAFAVILCQTLEMLGIFEDSGYTFQYYPMSNQTTLDEDGDGWNLRLRRGPITVPTFLLIFSLAWIGYQISTYGTILVFHILRELRPVEKRFVNRNKWGVSGVDKHTRKSDSWSSKNSTRRSKRSEGAADGVRLSETSAAMEQANRQSV